MIFKQVDEILSGQKTQTRRVVKPGERILRWTPGDETIGAVTTLTNRMQERAKWAIGHTYAVVPKRGMPGVWWTDQYGISGEILTPKSRRLLSESKFPIGGLVAKGWHPLRIRILAIRQERLQDISEADAKAEGVADVEAYRALWQAINGKTPGARWDANPMVWVLTFEVVKERETQS